MTADEKIKTSLIEEEVKTSYLNYAVSVIVSRALPDARDGLKPSQRRILVAMNDLGLTPKSKFRKCAKIAGDTSGNYHPHGETVVYPTLVRMAQDFVMRYRLVDGQGNFGSVDGDPPAAMRYTEARLTEFAMMLLEDIDKDTVNFIPNYDNTREEPTVLPGKFPNLICCGSSGIAVGMMSSIPPHNLTEVCEAIIKLIDNPNISIDELLQYIKGPDFPTGGIILGEASIREAYQRGHGLITIRGKVEIEERKNEGKNIIITQLPYNQNKAALLENIAELVKEEKIQGVSDIRDESAKDDIRVVIEVRRGENENVIINQLYANTSLQSTFIVDMLALVDNRPKVLNLKDVLNVYISHRVDVIRRRTNFLLRRATENAHILEGLLIAIESIDEVISIIKKSSTAQVAREGLIVRFQLSHIQAEAILRMTLQKLTGLEYEKIRQDLKELNEKIAEYKAILADENLILDIIKEDLFEMKEKYGDKRRTQISRELPQKFLKEELIPQEDMVVLVSHEGYIKRIPLDTYRNQSRGGIGIIGTQTKEEDFIEYILVAQTHDFLLLFSDIGKVYKIKVYEIPLLSRIAKGKPL